MAIIKDYGKSRRIPNRARIQVHYAGLSLYS